MKNIMFATAKKDITHCNEVLLRKDERAEFFICKGNDFDMRGFTMFLLHNGKMNTLTYESDSDFNKDFDVLC